MSKTGQSEGPLVTVLMSTYNRPAYVGQALESILRQSYRNIQAVVVRDGGQPVGEVIGRYADPRVVFIDRDQNRGLPYSFNEALSHARGDYICYLGDDDLLYPYHVETLMEAALRYPQFGAVYSDLYKAHCRIETDGRRTVLAKNVEISRDFDRFALLQFNHTLHVSLMHRRDLLNRAGLYNENLICLIDWDLTRRLCFFTDFLHVPKVTGEYYAAIPDYQQRCERISSRKQKSLNRYILNYLTIQSTRPPKPWPKMKDLSLILVADGFSGQTEQALREIWSHTFYPYQIYLPLARSELDQLQRKTIVPNILGIPVPERCRREDRIDAALRSCQGELVAVVPDTWRIGFDEVAWIEKSLFPLLQEGTKSTAFELLGSRPECWGVVLDAAVLRQARARYPQLPLRESLMAAGVTIQLPQQTQWPFQMENLITNAEYLERNGAWSDAELLYEMAEHRYGNELWMRTRRANALYRAGRYDPAGQWADAINRQRPTAASLMLEARIRRKQNRIPEALELYQKARDILEGSEFRHAGYANGIV
jgi:glycosyltransferase involved in cell wall biosynthesis